MGLLRSETMKYARLVLPTGPDAKVILEAMGMPDGCLSQGSKFCSVEFVDSNAKLMSRPFKNYVSRVDDLMRILKVVRDDIATSDLAESRVTSKIQEFFQNKELDFESVEKELKVYDEQFKKLADTNERLLIEKLEVEQELELLTFAAEYLSRTSAGGTDMATPLLGEADGLGLCNIAGVVDTKDKNRLWKAIWRASRGKAYFQSGDVKEFTDKNGSKCEKEVFVVYFQGAVESAMKARLERVAIGYGASLYSWPSYGSAAATRRDQLKQNLSEKEDVLKEFTKSRNQDREDMVRPVCSGGNSKAEEYWYFVKKEKSIYSTLNKFEEGQTLQTDVWFPECEAEALKALLDSVKVATKPLLIPQKLPSGQEPPTFTKINDFTAPWQLVVDTYGIPNYQTLNPAVITTVTFPFIFGMMYGDIGHGSLLFCAGLLLCWFGPSVKYSMPEAHMARYVILQMGFFAVFAGFMYNDLFGIISLELFETRWDATADATSKLHSPIDSFDHRNLGVDNSVGPYPFGMDYSWHGKANELLEVNSLKMKLSVLMGVLQMTLGVFLKWSNAVHDRSKIDFFCECIPMLMFMMCFFGYMDFMILYKWTHVIPGTPTDPHTTWEGAFTNSSGPPGIINSLICMAMHTADPQPLWAGSTGTASMCMLGVVLSVPWLLCPKPFLLKHLHQKSQRHKAKKVVNQVMQEVVGDLQDETFEAHPTCIQFVEAAMEKYPDIKKTKEKILQLQDSTYEASRASVAETRAHYGECRQELLEVVEEMMKKESKSVVTNLRDEIVAVAEAHHLDMGDEGGGHGHGGKFEFGEILIHQIIETIEFVLGTVSHTASYLRIWALSLAHQQLSDVFYKKTLGMGLVAAPNPILGAFMVWFLFGAWFLVTVLVLLMMDVLECFLHTLRLHWVEFQSKFYKNTGTSFRPYDILAVVMEEDK